MTDGPWLIDKSALYRIPNSPDAEVWLSRINRGLVHISTPTSLEVGHSALGATDWRNSLNGPPLSLMPLVYATPASERRAIEVQGILARLGQHRAPSVPDLLIAALAETQDLVVLHVDKDFELIAGVTGQLIERLRVTTHT
ncbi:MAG: PIN domain nuclease [Gordonia amarae]